LILKDWILCWTIWAIFDVVDWDEIDTQ